MNLIVAYLVVTGGVTAGLQAGRGLVRGLGQCLSGAPLAGLAEVAGGFLAPVKSACEQAMQLGEDACTAAARIALSRIEETPPLEIMEQTPFVPPPLPVRKRRRHESVC